MNDLPRPTNAYAILEWARTPCNHGGTNPYCQEHVKRAEHEVAAFEGRPVEAFAKNFTPEKE